MIQLVLGRVLRLGLYLSGYQYTMCAQLSINKQ